MSISIYWYEILFQTHYIKKPFRIDNCCDDIFVMDWNNNKKIAKKQVPSYHTVEVWAPRKVYLGKIRLI